jgi:hypothetical protein
MSDRMVQMTDTEAAIRLLAGLKLTALAVAQTKQEAQAPGRRGHGRFFWDGLFDRVYGRRR